MKNVFRILFLFLLSHTGFAQVDYLGLQSITFEDETYELKWSAYIDRTKVMEEYTLPEESNTRYTTKFIVEFTRNDFESVTEAKWDELTYEKQEGRVLNCRNAGDPDSDEVVYEFMIGNVRNGETISVEWNVYRYRQKPDGAVILFAMSKRAYESKNISSFMEEMNKERLNWINSVINYQLPEIPARK